MADVWPPSLKALKPYLQRAKELEVAQPLVSYYCNLYALQRGIRERDATDEAAARFVKSLLTKCESLRARFAAGSDSHRGQLEEFAMGVYDGAERTYRAGNADAGTARHFYAAMCFLDVCTHFGDLTADLARMRGQSRVFAALIQRDLREGRRPVPPEVLGPKPAAEEAQDEAELARELSNTSLPAAPAPPKREIPPAPPVESYAGPDLVSSTTASTMYAGLPFVQSTQSVVPPPEYKRAASPPLTPSPPPTPPPPPVQAAAPPANTFAAPIPRATPGFRPDTKAVGQAQRLAKFAVSALDFQDTDTAVKNLTAALKLLTSPAVAPP
jgi:vacuolar protein sorting-associated protein VTA1